MKKYLLKFYIAAFYLCSSLTAFAQPGDDNAAGNLEDVDPPAPIDDYIWVLLAIGLTYVFLRLRSFAAKKAD